MLAQSIDTVSKHVTAAIITPSYYADLRLAEDLCESVDQFADPAIDHILIVPRRDIGKFSHLASRRRSIVPAEAILPDGFRRIPMSRRLLPHDIWLTPQAGPRSGWMIQQVIKLSVPNVTSVDIFIFIDSDVVLIKEITASMFCQNGKVRLFYRPGGFSYHRKSHIAASKILRLPDYDESENDYIGHLITWRRSNVLQLHRHIETKYELDWRIPLITGRKRFSEYILYGLFCNKVLADKGGHYLDSSKITCSLWKLDPKDMAAVRKFEESLEPQHFAIGIQSAIPISIEARRTMIAKMVARRQVQ